MSAISATRSIPAGFSVVATLLPTVTIVSVAFLVIGLAMPVLPLHVHQGLGLGMVVVGLVAGAQFAASLLSRFFAGHQADERGAKRAIVTGLVMAVAAGVLYEISLGFVRSPGVSVAILLTGRAVLGGAESFIVAGALVWGLAVAGSRNTGMVMAWIGTPMYVAYAIGAPLGSALYARYGFVAIALVTALVPLAALGLAASLRAVPPRPHPTTSIRSVWRAIRLPGLGLALSSLGFGAITTFVALLYAVRGWSGAWLAFTVLSAAFVVGRLAFGHLPDRVGGPRVAIVCVAIEAAGQALIWLAHEPALLLAGVALTGFGYSLIYPSFGVDAVRRAPPQSRGLATGAYSACLDLALGIGNPTLGLVASNAGVASVFLVSALAVMAAAAVAIPLLAASSPTSDARED